ncbi:beta-galactosidase [Dictyobacter sp. S3.2.2.5]|uniref:Beta-galactosidase n=1 Tax=Dictyobacter halimunensis TaxID=3026934 RepID=A0ABQ6FK06_9CHLR|nr:beta-galactosidase [Dictyobacter sp. S3.2.2.5]
MIKQPFDLDWEYSEASGMMAQFFAQWQPINLPHDAMIGKPRAANNPSGSHGGYFPGNVANYRKKFFAPEDWKGQSVQLEFEGVYMNAEVSVNRQLLRLQPYGYTSFVVDITPALAYGQENEVMVSANTTAQPNSRWYSGTGIYRHVWLRRGGDIHIKPWGIFVTTPIVDPAASVIHVSTELASISESHDGAILRTTIFNGESMEIAQTETPLKGFFVQQTLLVKEARLWSVDKPYLYTLLSEVLLGDSVIDTETTTFGIRSIRVDAQNGFRLNGVPLKLKGGCIHHDHGPLGAASYDRAEERKVEVLKSAGFNALRSAHNPPAPALLDACDRLGLLVIDETFDCWRQGKNPNDYHVYFEEWWQRDTAALVKRDRNHPSVIMWSIGNEILEALGIPDGASWSRRQADFVRSLDSTRFVTSAILMYVDFEESGVLNQLEPSPVPDDPEKDIWAKMTTEFAQPLDVVGYNYMHQRYAGDGARYPCRIIAGTETWPHMAYDYWEETERLPHVIGDFVWTAWDYLGEAGIGQVTSDGKLAFAAPYPYHLANTGDFDTCGFKRPQSFYRDLLWGVRTEPFIGVLDPQLADKPLKFLPWGWEPVIESWTFPGAEDRSTRVDIYAVDEEVELFINGVSFGRKPVSQNKATFDAIYQPGIVEAVSYCGGEKRGHTSLKTAGAPAALRLTPDRSTINSTYGDLAYITVNIVDQDGDVVPTAEHEVSFEVSGAGELIALGTANPLSEEPYVGKQRKAWHGRLLAIVRSNGQTGDIIFSAHADGLPSSEIRLSAAVQRAN